MCFRRNLVLLFFLPLWAGSHLGLLLIWPLGTSLLLKLGAHHLVHHAVLVQHLDREKGLVVGGLNDLSQSHNHILDAIAEDI